MFQEKTGAGVLEREEQGEADGMRDEVGQVFERPERVEIEDDSPSLCWSNRWMVVPDPETGTLLGSKAPSSPVLTPIAAPRPAPLHPLLSSPQSTMDRVVHRHSCC